MAAPDARLDSDNATIIEIKGGSLVSFAPSVPFAVSDDSSDGNKDPDEAETGQRPDGPTGFVKPRPVSGASRVSVPGVPSTTSIIKASSLRHPDAGTALKASKSRVTIATVATSRSAVRETRSTDSSIDNGPTRRLIQRQRSIYSLTGQSEAEADGTEAEGDAAEGDAADDESAVVRDLNLKEAAAFAFRGHLGLGVAPRERIPDGLAKLLRELPDPRELAPLVRSVIISADRPSRHVMHFKSTTKVQRVGLRPAVHVARAARVRIGRRKREGQGGIMYQPTYKEEPNEVPDWRRVRALMKEIMALGLKDVSYSSFLAENGSRILAAAIVQRFKSFNLDRYRLVAKVRIAQKINQGMAMYVACLWHADVDRFSYVQFENSNVAAQAVLFMVYRD